MRVIDAVRETIADVSSASPSSEQKLDNAAHQPIHYIKCYGC